VRVHLAVLDNYLGKVSLVRDTVNRDEGWEIARTLDRAGGRSGRHAAAFDEIYRTLRNSVTVVTDFVLIAVAIFMDAVGEDVTAILQMDRVRRCRRQGEHEHHSE